MCDDHYQCLFLVNLAHTPTQGLQGTASMSQPSQKTTWSAVNAVDGNTDQELLTTCAVMDYSKTYSSVWWKVRLGRRFNVAYLEVYFRGSSMSHISVLLLKTSYFIQNVQSLSSISLYHLNSQKQIEIIRMHAALEECSFDYTCNYIK